MFERLLVDKIFLSFLRLLILFDLMDLFQIYIAVIVHSGSSSSGFVKSK